jgi:hypothetical protein
MTRQIIFRLFCVFLEARNSLEPRCVATLEKYIFFLIPFYLQAVHVHLANGVNLNKA